MWLDPFLRDTLASLLVWPNRIVVPILPESQCGSLDHLKLRSVCGHGSGPRCQHSCMDRP